MAVIKNQKTGMWEVRTYYKDWTGTGYYFNPWAGIDNDCNYIDDKCKQETQKKDIPFLFQLF